MTSEYLHISYVGCKLTELRKVASIEIQTSRFIIARNQSDYRDLVDGETTYETRYDKKT